MDKVYLLWFHDMLHSFSRWQQKLSQTKMLGMPFCMNVLKLLWALKILVAYVCLPSISWEDSCQIVTIISGKIFIIFYFGVQPRHEYMVYLFLLIRFLSCYYHWVDIFWTGAHNFSLLKIGSNILDSVVL